jgi:protein-tyrosine kinase
MLDQSDPPSGDRRRNVKRVVYRDAVECFVDLPEPMPPVDAINAISLDPAHLVENGIYGFLSNDPRARPFNILRAQVIRRMERNNWRVLAVTSTRPGAGKSFTAYNLATSLSRVSGTGVVLVDLDLRLPTLATRFGLQEGKGICSYITDNEPLENVCLRVENENLLLLPTFERHFNSAELLAASRAQRLLEALQNLPENHICIVDVPPIFENDDTMIISDFVDAILFVVEDGRSTEQELREGLRLIEPIPILGTVLNKVPKSMSMQDYSYYYYRK